MNKPEQLMLFLGLLLSGWAIKAYHVVGRAATIAAQSAP
jgi:hypothetical protein